MSENSREEEKLSFKEQILRDLERLKREDGIANTKSSNDDLFSNLSNSSESEKPVEEPSVEDLMANSVSLVDELLANAPTVPPRPVLQDDSVGTSVASEPAVAPDPYHQHNLYHQRNLLNPLSLLNLLNQWKKRKSSMLFRQGFQFLIVRIRPNQVLLERILNLKRNQQFLQKKLQVKNQLLQLKLELNFLEEVVKSQ